MTLVRAPGSIKAAVDRCRRTLGPDAEALTGKTEDYLYKCSHPDHEGRNISVKDAVALDRGMRVAGHGHPIFDAYAALLGGVPSGRAGECPKTAFLGVAAQTGTLAQSVADAMADGVIDLRERRQIAAACHELVDAVRMLLDAIEPPGELVTDLGRRRAGGS
jgi:hypothetical protein